MRELRGEEGVTASVLYTLMALCVCCEFTVHTGEQEESEADSHCRMTPDLLLVNDSDHPQVPIKYTFSHRHTYCTYTYIHTYPHL